MICISTFCFGAKCFVLDESGWHAEAEIDMELFHQAGDPCWRDCNYSYITIFVGGHHSEMSTFQCSLI